MADIMDLYSQSASHNEVVFISLTVRCCRYFLDQNAQIENGNINGKVIYLKALGIGDGITV